MRILAIETSCDETAVSLLETTEKSGSLQFLVRGNALLSQVDLHQEYGGVYPNLAKREHAKNLVPLLEKVLREAKMLEPTKTNQLTKERVDELKELLHREPELFSRSVLFLATHKRPLIDPVRSKTPELSAETSSRTSNGIDIIAVTNGPGLEPALWVGINFAKTLSTVWDIPVVPVNHMEGHIFSSVIKQIDDKLLEIPPVKFPAIALLISGGHTELVQVNNWPASSSQDGPASPSSSQGGGSYEVVGETRDDAVGEAFDKVARMLDLPYPGGPEISRLAEAAREQNLVFDKDLPRPMIDSDNLDFSFSGLKTSVLYLLKKMDKPDEKTKMKLARAFEDAVADVLVTKTSHALTTSKAKTLIIGGGVSANKHLRKAFQKLITTTHSNVSLFIPESALTTDNAIMIAVAGNFRAEKKSSFPYKDIVAEGNLAL